MKQLMALVVSTVLIAASITGCTKAPSKSEETSGTLSAQDSSIAENTVQENDLQKTAEGFASVLTSDYGVSSVQYALIDHGELILSGSYATQENSDVTAETIFGIGSLSKIYVTAAAMKLTDDGKVDIDQPLVTYIPEFEMADQRYKQITPRMLMNHSSGIYGSTFHNGFLFESNDTETHDDLLKHLRSQTLKANPGEFSVYCNDGFQLLEIMIERVSGMGYTQYLDETFFEPLGLTNTKTPLSTFDRQRLALIYHPVSGELLPVEAANVLGTGGLYSTAEDVCRFAQVLMGDNPDILSKQSVLAMQQEEYKNGIWTEDDESIFGYGLGWDVVNTPPLSYYNIRAQAKGGDTSLYHSSLIVIPEHDMAMAVITSGGSSIYNNVFAFNLLLEALNNKGIITEIQPDKTFNTPVPVPITEEIKAASGIYGTITSTAIIDIQSEKVTFPPVIPGFLSEEEYIHIGDGIFQNQDGNVSVQFVDESNGKTYLQAKGYLDLPGLGQAVLTFYSYQKLLPNPMDTSVMSAWEKRNHTRYYAVSEKAVSQDYCLDIYKDLSVDVQNGYAMGSKIIDADHAIAILQIPSLYGRDVKDISFYRENDAEYLQMQEMLYISEDALTPISMESTSSYSIPESGYAQWYKITEEIAGKTITVTMPESGAFAVYDSEGQYTAFSIISKGNQAVLPENGSIVFVGEPSSEFHIFIQ